MPRVLRKDCPSSSKSPHLSNRCALVGFLLEMFLSTPRILFRSIKHRAWLGTIFIPRRARPPKQDLRSYGDMVSSVSNEEVIRLALFGTKRYGLRNPCLGKTIMIYLPWSSGPGSMSIYSNSADPPRPVLDTASVN